VSAAFNSTPDGAFRKAVRDAIRKSYLSKSQQAVVVAVVNLWFYHRNGPKGHIHPGRTLLAKKAKVSVRTVATTLAMMRDGNALIAIGRLRGEGQKPTQYRVDLRALFDFCGADVPESADGELTPYRADTDGQSCTPLCTPLAHHWRADFAHSLTDVRHVCANGAETKLRVVNGGRF
jgi:hypothetical protein